MEILIKNGKMEWKGSIRKTYDQYLHPINLDYKNEDMWKLVGTGTVPDLFQFSTQVGIQTAKLVKPKNLVELAHANSLMRLMGDGTITPTEKYLQFRENPQLWYKEMADYHLTKEEIIIMEKYLKPYFGVSATQEDLMLMSMDSGISGFDLVLANKLRKSIAKKKAELVKEIKDILFTMGQEKGNSINILNYFWDKHIVPQLGYAFSLNHTTPYSVICLQELNLIQRFGQIYWNCAVLSINAGVTDSFGEDKEDNDEFEDENAPKKRGTKYGKIAKAIGEMKANGSNITLPHINKSQVSFSVDEAKDSIVYGLKGISGIGDLEIELILKNRPYKNLSDFIEKLGKKEEKKTKKDKEEKKDEKATYISGTKIIALIKSGCFDELESKPREQILKEYVMQISEPNKSLKAVNIPKLMEWKLVPSEFALEVKMYGFRKYTFSKEFFYKQDKDFSSKKWYKLNDRSKKFFEEHFEVELEEDKDFKYTPSGDLLVIDTHFDRVYKKKIAKLSDWLSSEEALEKFNQNKFLEVWEKYCQGTISKWEMDTLNFYYNEHELANLNKLTYNLSDFFELDEKPVVENQWQDKKTKRKFNIYKLERICGTVLDKDRNKHIVDILTPSGVVSVKFYGGTYTHYDKQLSKLDEKTGKKTVIEKSWFSRGSKVMVVGFRREDQFVPKKYKNSPFKHTVQKIVSINDNGTVDLQDERKQI